MIFLVYHKTILFSINIASKNGIITEEALYIPKIMKHYDINKNLSMRIHYIYLVNIIYESDKI